MNTIIRQEILSLAIGKVKAMANKGIWNGKDFTPYFLACQWLIEELGCQVIFTREEGYHSSGWWKNPDYERCYHLSVSFPGGRDVKRTAKLVDLIFGANHKLLWVEPPYSKEAVKAEVWHYRLFCNEFWQPVKPRGEVYSTQFTERGWKSFSDVQYDRNKTMSL